MSEAVAREGAKEPFSFDAPRYCDLEREMTSLSVNDDAEAWFQSDDAPGALPVSPGLRASHPVARPRRPRRPPCFRTISSHGGTTLARRQPQGSSDSSRPIRAAHRRSWGPHFQVRQWHMALSVLRPCHGMARHGPGPGQADGASTTREPWCTLTLACRRGRGGGHDDDRDSGIDGLDRFGSSSPASESGVGEPGATSGPGMRG